MPSVVQKDREAICVAKCNAYTAGTEDAKGSVFHVLDWGEPQEVY